MPGPFYQFWTYDQTQFNWLTQIIDKDGTGYAVPFHFLEAFCPNRKCHGLDQDRAFALGWQDRIVRVRPRKGRNVLVTDDHFLCVDDALLHSLVTAAVKGFEHKPLPGSGWNVLRITERRRFDRSVYATEGSACPICARQRQYGSIRFERQIEPPTEPLTFFSTDTPRGQGGFDLFVTEALAKLLVQSNASGGQLERLLTAEEESQQKTNPKSKTKNAYIFLGQHRHTIND